MPTRWDRISEDVPGKTRAECIARFKQIAALLKAKRTAAAAAAAASAAAAAAPG
jgi:DnaJ family protein C protein 2